MPWGGAALPHGHVGRPGALRSAVARGWHRGCGTGAPRDPSASAGASLRCPSRVTHSSPTRPDPTRPLQWDRSAVCVSVCPQPSTAQHCTALHSTACGPAGTFPHRVPGLWGCGAVGLWGDGVEVLAGGCLQHMWCTAGTAPSPRRSGWGGSHCSMGLRAPITSSRSPIPVGLRRAAPPPEVPGTSGCCWLPPRPRCCCEGLPVSSSVPGIPAVPPAHGRGGGNDADRRPEPPRQRSVRCVL